MGISMSNLRAIRSNTMKTIRFVTLFINLFWATSCLALQPGEGVVLDPATGDYIISYRDGTVPGNPLYQVRFIPSTKIDPILLSRFYIEKEKQIRYSYTITNGVKGRQPLIDFGFGEISALTIPKDTPLISGVLAGTWGLTTPAGWNGFMAKKDTNYVVSWTIHPVATRQDGLQPGKSQGGFSFSSPDLPGLDMAEISGNGDPGNFPNEGPDDEEILNQYSQLQGNDFLTRPAAIPMISIPAPFDAAVLLNNIQTQMHAWIGMNLLDSTFSSQLDRYLTAAADAYRHNQPKAAKEDIERVREMLKKEHQDLGRDEENENGNSRETKDNKKPAAVDRLAARVLDFDLMYVLRLGGDRD